VETKVIEMGRGFLLKIIYVAIKDKADELNELDVTNEAVDELNELVVDNKAVAWWACYGRQGH
jgi:hypothetical protein